MPGYIGFTPQFNPISLQEYLTVPTMLQQEFDTYEEKYNENLDKLAALEGMLDESTKDYLNPYKSKLQNAADIISGKTGNLGSLRQQTNAARQFYREYAPKLTNAYNKRQAALKTQQEILLKDPSAVTTQIGNMQSFIDNPDQTLHSLSGDKVYNDMLKAGQLSAADITKSNINKASATGYLNQIIKTGYTLEEQKIYADLVRRAFAGDVDADKILKNTDIYTQPYQALQKYVEDNKFNKFNSSEQNYIFNRALTGQLLGMNGTEKSNLIADKQWEHNSRMAAARASAATNTQIPQKYQIGNHFIRPKDRVASFGKEEGFKEHIGNAFTYKDGKLVAKQGKDLSNTIGLANSNSMSSVADITEFEDLLFTKDGRLKTPEELKDRRSELAARKAGLKDPTRVILPDNYKKFYQQLIDLGFDPNTKFNTTEDVIVTEGTWKNPTQRIESRRISRSNQLMNILNSFAENHNTNNPSNVGYTNVAINTTEESLKDAIKSASEDFSTFKGLTRTDGKLTYNNTGKRKKKSDIINQVEKHGGTLEYSPAAEGYIVTIQNDDKDKYYINEHNWDETRYNYTSIDWNGYNNTLSALDNELNNAQQEYAANPTEDNYNYYLEILRRYNLIAQQYDTEISELEKGFGSSEAFSGMTNYNPNTSTFHK